MLDNIKDNIDTAVSGVIMKRRGRAPKLRALIRMLVRFLDDMRKDHVAQYAAQVAFFTVLSAVPFLMIMLLCLKYVVSVDVVSFTDAVAEAFPVQVSVYLSQIITEVFYRSESIALMSVTVIAALWSSSRGIMAVYCGINQIYGYVRVYNWFGARLTSLIYNILFLIVIMGSVLILVFGNALLGIIGSEHIFVHYTLELIFRLKFPIFFVLFVLSFTAIYTFLPQRKVKFRSQLPGGTITAAGWIVFSYAFSIYVEYFAGYSVLYGSLTAIILLMLWLYFCMYMLLIGAEINKHVETGYFKRVKKLITSNKK